MRNRDLSTAMAIMLLRTLAFFTLAVNLATCQSFIGVNYGQVADNLPPPSATAKLLQSTSIQKVRLYGSDPAIIKAIANTGIGIVIGAANGDIPGLASDQNFAKSWVDANVAPFYPASNIILITVGNEVLTSGDQGLISQLVPAIQNVQNALDSSSLGGKIKVSTVHSMAVLKQSEPPSSGSFDPGFGDVMKWLLAFNSATGSPFAINPYPYFAYRSDPRPETLAFCLFQPNGGRFDSKTNIKYMNMFDAQVDAIRSALDSMGAKNVEIVVAETGWPYKGDSNEVGPSVENAKAYNGNLIAHLRSMAGTPLMPGKSVDTYLFALYDENLKPGPGSERAFGLFKPDLTMTYDVGLSKTRQTPSTPSSTPSTPSTTPSTPSTTPSTPSAVPQTPVNPSAPKPKKAAWCLPKAGVSDSQLQANIDYVCGHGFDCSPIQQGGACFEPNTVQSHAAYAMNLLYQTAGGDPLNCDFSQTATLSSNNPSYDGCHYPAQTIRCAVCQAVTRVADSRALPPAPSSSSFHRPPPPSTSPYNHAPPGPPPSAHGRKRALICAVSYKRSRHELKGCINDAKCMKYLLVNKFSFPESSILMLTEEESDPYRRPTKQNMRMAMFWLVQGCQAGDSLVFHYSGHGSQQRNYTGDEVDGYDETLCPSDFETQGMIVDDEINATIVRPLPPGVRLHAIVDACHSGTVLDLPFLCRMDRSGKYVWEDHRPRSGVWKGTNGGEAISFSGCDDDQTSADTSALSKITSTGAMTYAFIQAIERGHGNTYGNMLNAMRSTIRNTDNDHGGGIVTSLISMLLTGGSLGGLRQEPQLTANQPFDVYTKPFSL